MGIEAGRLKPGGRRSYESAVPGRVERAGTR